MPINTEQLIRELKTYGNSPGSQVQITTFGQSNAREQYLVQGELQRIAFEVPDGKAPHEGNLVIDYAWLAKKQIDSWSRETDLHYYFAAPLLSHFECKGGRLEIMPRMPMNWATLLVMPSDWHGGTLLQESEISEHVAH